LFDGHGRFRQIAGAVRQQLVASFPPSGWQPPSRASAALLLGVFNLSLAAAAPKHRRSAIGGIAKPQEMLDFCATRGILCEIERARLTIVGSMKSFLLCALILAGCAAPRQPNSTEALAEEKRQALANRRKQDEKVEAAKRLAVREIYVQDHPDLKPEIRKAILKERIKVGMSVWQVIAAYSLWEYTNDPQTAKYRSVGTLPLWTLADWRQAAPGQIQQWTLRRQKETKHLFFEEGLLKKWTD
jgi:hypothetical protein